MKALAAVGLAAAALEFVKKNELWPDFVPTHLAAGVSFFAGVLVFVVPFLQERLNNYGLKKLAQELALARDLRASMLTPLETAVEVCGPRTSNAWKGASIHVMQVQTAWIGFEWRWWPFVSSWDLKRPWRLWTLCPFRFTVRWPRVQAQQSVARVGFTSTQSSGILWTKGKGVIGKCWADEHEVPAHLDEFNTLVPGKPPEWGLFNTPTTFNLNHTECQKIVGKYASIFAVPLKDAKGKYIGCVVADSVTKMKNAEKIVGQLHRLAGTVEAMMNRD